jgi:8-oxo-dGTP pyrophosphatase MutT (NUDIX family)
MGSAVRKLTLPDSFAAFKKSDVRTQYAALCYRIRKDAVQVLLVTSRDSGRWVVPKGWPMKGRSAAEAAEVEAWEEAGVTGKMQDRCLGVYSYLKGMDDAHSLPVVVAVYPLLVESAADDFPEAGQRRRKWFDAKKASGRVVEPELRRILRKFDPKQLRQ